MGELSATPATPAPPDVADSTAMVPSASGAASPPAPPASPAHATAEAAAESVPGLVALVGAAATAAGGFALCEGDEDLQKAIDASIEREYRTKRVRTLGRDAVIVLQNENGPCPLLAIANALALRGALTLPATGPPSVAHSALTAHVAAAILDAGGGGAAGNTTPPPPDPNREQNVSDAMAALPKLGTGLDVNVRFTAIDAFEFTGEIAIFDLLRLPLVHGWLVDRGDAATAAAVGTMSYNELAEKLCGNVGAEQAALLQSFLADTASQLTPPGLRALQSVLPDGATCVFFRNNHFATAHKAGGRFFLLVTDEGYRAEDELVWEELSDVGGDTPFLTGAFEPYVPRQPPAAAADGAPGGAMGGLGALTDAAATAAASAGSPPDEATKALLRQMQEEDDLEAAKKLSRELEGSRRSASSAGAVAALPAGGGEQLDSGTSRQQPGGQLARELFAAVERNNAEALQIALASGLDMNARDFMGRTPLHWAASNGQLELASLLANNGARTDLADDNGHTALHLAALAGCADVCIELLNCNAPPDARAHDGLTPAAAAEKAEVRQAIERHPRVLEAAQRAAARAAVAQLSPPAARSQVARRDTDMAEAEGSQGSGGSAFFRRWF